MSETNPSSSPSFSIIGPGLVLAATGVGAGDMIAAAVSGERYGLAVAWAAVVGAVLKFALNEGLARWQLATRTTLLEGWATHLGRGVQFVFLLYLVIWSFFVAGALIAACGLAAHAIVPGVSLEIWAVLHSVAAAALVLTGGYERFEKLVGVFVGVMFVTLVASALIVDSPIDSLSGVIRLASVPQGSGSYLLGVIGGVGGSVTLLAYGYWIRERGWRGEGAIKRVRLDLLIAYSLTGLFGLAVMILAAATLHGGEGLAGGHAALTMARMLGDVAGPVGRWVFLLGFWGAVATSMLGVWQGVPYLFADFMRLYRRSDAKDIDTASVTYRGYLLYLALPPMLLLFTGKPVMLAMLYAVMSALFMPFLAGTLLYLTLKKDVMPPALRTGPILGSLLLVCLGLFGFLAGSKILDMLRSMG